MRVGIVAWEFPPKLTGGLGRHLYGLITALKKNTELIIYMPEQNAPETIEGVTLKKFDSEKSGDNFVKDVNRKIAEQVKKDGLSLLHCQDWVSFYTVLLVKKSKICPVICSIHSTVHDRSGRIVSEKNKYLQLETRALKKADAIITVSNYMKKRLNKHLKIKNEKIFVIPNGISHKETKFSEKEGKNILYFGRITEQKGVEYLLYAMKQMPNEKLIVLGGGHLQDSVESFAKMLKVDATFLPFTNNQDEIDKIIADSKMVIMPSISEPFGLVALEAIAAKRATILSKFSGVSEYLEHNKHTIIINPLKPEEITRAIKLLQNDETRREIVANAYELLESGKLSWENVADITRGLYEQITLQHL